MNKIKKYIIVTISLIIIIVGILLIYSSKPVQTKINEEIGDSGEETDYNNSIICEVEDINKYYSVQLITNSYMYSLLEQDADSLYNVLDPQYINQFNINKDNIISKLGKIDVSNIEEEMDNYNNNYDINEKVEQARIQNEKQRIYEEEEYNRQVNEAINKAYHDAYIQDLKSRGYKIRYKKTIKDYIKNFVAFIITLFIMFLLIQIPFVKRFFMNFYNENEIIHYLVDVFLNIFNIQ